MPESLPFQTKREEVLEAYDEYGRAYEVNTKPYHSTRALEGEVVEVNEADQFAYLVISPQVLEFFGYGVGERITIGDRTRQASDADTNLAKAKSTNGAADFVVEGLGFSCRGFRARDNSAALGHATRYHAAATNPAVVAAIAGERPVVDPGSIFLPPQVYSPFNLENALFQGLIGYMSVELEWDRRRTEKLGASDLMPQGGAQSYLRSNGEPRSSDLMPQGGAQSYLRSNGEPRSDNRWKVPEGYIWRREGQPDSELLVRLRVEEEVVVPLSLLNDPDVAANTVAPDRIYLDIVARVFGLEVELPSGN